MKIKKDGYTKMTDNKDKEQSTNANLVPARKDAPFRVKAVGLQARKQALANKQALEQDIPVDPNKATHRIGILFDDSASMGGTKISDAHAGTEEFLRSCNPKDTAVAVHPMNVEGRYYGSDGHRKIPLTNKMYAACVSIKTFRAIGSTPLFSSLQDMITTENLTRGIVFSDGEPNSDDERLMDSVLTIAVEKGISVDTVFIGSKNDTKAVEIMKTIAERTGGIFMVFEPGKANFRTAFKYLSPGYRAMLADKSFVAKLEEGKV